MLVKAPDYVRLSVTYYVTSESANVNTAVCVSNASSFDTTAFPGGLASAIEVVNSLTGETDARGMTAEEVTEYVHQQQDLEED